MSILIRKFLKLIYPFVEFISKTHLPFTRKKINGKHFYEWEKILEPGDVFLTTTRGELSNLINPAEWKHGAVYYGKVEGIHQVYEATGKGVYKKDLVSFLTSKDYVKIFRHRGMVKPCPLAKFLDSIEGRPYDRVFSTENQSFYCFEIIAEGLTRAICEYQPKMEKIFGEYIYTDKTFTHDASFMQISK